MARGMLSRREVWLQRGRIDLAIRAPIALPPPDVPVSIPVNDVRTMDFHRADAMVSLGRAATTQALEDADLEGGTS